MSKISPAMAKAFMDIMGLSKVKTAQFMYHSTDMEMPDIKKCLEKAVQLPSVNTNNSYAITSDQCKSCYGEIG